MSPARYSESIYLALAVCSARSGRRGREQWPLSSTWRIVRSEKHLWGQAGCKRSKGKGKRTTLPSRPLAWRLGTGERWEETGGLTRTHPAPRRQAPPLNPPRGWAGRVRRADWLKDQPHPCVCKAIPPSAPLAYPRARAPAARVSSGLWAPSSPGSSASAKPPPHRTRSKQVSEPCWAEPRPGSSPQRSSSLPCVFSEGLVSGDSLGADGISFKCNTYGPVGARLCVNPSPGSFHFTSPPPPPGGWHC